MLLQACHLGLTADTSSSERFWYRDIYLYGAIIVILLLAYAPLYFYNFSFADDYALLTGRSPKLSSAIIDYYQKYARPFQPITLAMQNKMIAVGFDLAGFRLTQLVAFGGFTLILLKTLLPKQAGNLLIFTLACVMLALPSTQVHFFYATIHYFLIGYIISFSSFLLVLRGRVGPSLLAIILLAVSFHFYQTTPFFILACVNIWGLRIFLDRATQRDQLLGVYARAVIFLFLAVGLSTLAFKIVTQFTGVVPYRLADAPLRIMGGDLDALWHLLSNISESSNIFEIWSYPIGTKVYGGYLKLLHGVAAIFFLVALGVISRARKTYPLAAWYSLLTICSFLISLIPIFAEGFTGRQHVYLVPQVLLLTILVAVFLVSFRGKLGFVAAGASVVLLLSVYGNVYRNIVHPNAYFYERVYSLFESSDQSATEVGRQASSVPAVDVSVVIDKNEEINCFYEPCSGFFGRFLSSRFHLTRKKFYKRLARENNLRVGRFSILSSPGGRERDAPKESNSELVIDVERIRADYARSLVCSRRTSPC